MTITIASGKGGTGKTTVATNLACAAARNGRTVTYMDCDVEEPNGHLFLNPKWLKHRPVTRPVPRVDETMCRHCGTCAEICQFNAIAPLGVTVLVYAELCHGCGGCVMACPAGAISEVGREMGLIETGRAEAIGRSGQPPADIQFVRGVLNVGEPMSPPLIRQVKLAADQADLTIIDAPPGTSCPVMEAVRGSDFVILVTEPTPFGLNDLRLAVDMIHALHLRTGVVINRAGSGDRETVEYCRAHRLEILAEIPDDRRIAEAYSRGELICTALPEYRGMFAELLANTERCARTFAPESALQGGHER